MPVPPPALAAILALGASAPPGGLVSGNAMKRPVPPLNVTPGRAVRVADAKSFRRAVENAHPGDVVLVADGTYAIAPFVYMRGRKNVTVMGASRDPTKVILRGVGWSREDRGADILRVGACENVTIAHLTFRDSPAYSLKVEAEHHPRNVNIYNCHFHEFGTRAIKGSASREGHAVGGSIRHCYFENTKAPPAGWLFDGDYVTAIDMMALDGWTIADNEFRNIRGRNGGARGAIFFWVRSTNVVIERNLIVDCDRGIAIGNPSGSTNKVPDMKHVTNTVCRNNVVKTDPDSGIELAWVDGIDVHHNTVWRDDARGRGIRCIQKIGKVEIHDNLVRGRIDLAGDATEIDNTVGSLADLFVDPKAADFRLAGGARGLLNAGAPREDMADDFFGHARDARPDRGAVEHGAGPKRAASGPAAEPETSRAPRADDPFAAWRDAISAAAALCAAAKSEEASAGYLAIAEEAGDYAVVFHVLAASTERAPVCAVVTRAFAARGPTAVYVDIAGRPTRARLVGADASAASIEAMGNRVSIAWSVMSPRRLGGIAGKYAATGSDRVAIASFLAACGELDAARQELGRAREAGLPEEAGDVVMVLDVFVR